MINLEQELAYIQQHIPITANLGVKIESFDGNVIRQGQTRLIHHVIEVSA